MKDKLLVHFQEPLTAYYLDYSVFKSGGWKRIKGNSDMRLNLSNNSKNHQIICPVCKKLSDFEPKHGDAYKCGGCQSVIRTYGNMFYVWIISIKHIRKIKLKKLKLV